MMWNVSLVVALGMFGSQASAVSVQSDRHAGCPDGSDDVQSDNIELGVTNTNGEAIQMDFMGTDIEHYDARDVNNGIDNETIRDVQFGAVCSRNEAINAFLCYGDVDKAVKYLKPSLQDGDVSDNGSELTSSSIPVRMRPLPSGKVWGKPSSDASSQWDAPSVVSREFGATSQDGDVGGPGVRTDDELLLMQAMQSGDVGLVRVVLDRGNIDLNKSIYKSLSRKFAFLNTMKKEHLEDWTALMFSSNKGYHLIVHEFLTQDGIDVNKSDQFGFTGLIIACQHGHHAIVRELLNRPEIQVNQAEHQGFTGFIVASQNNHHAIVRDLLDREDVDVNQATKENKFTALMMASQNGQCCTIDELLTHPKINVNQVNIQRVTALMLACQKGHRVVVRNLLTHKDIQVNQVNWMSFTGLQLASQNGHHRVVRELLAHPKILVNQPDREGSAALVSACLRGHHDVVRVLLDHKDTEVNGIDEHGLTALIAASQNGHHLVVRELLSRQDLQVNQPDDVGAPPLYYASFNGQADVVRELLIHQQLHVNQVNNQGVTSLIAASQEGHGDTVHELLKHPNIDIHVRFNGRSAGEVARSKGHDIIAERLDNFDYEVEEREFHKFNEKRLEKQEKQQALYNLVKTFSFAFCAGAICVVILALITAN